MIVPTRRLAIGNNDSGYDPAHQTMTTASTKNEHSDGAIQSYTDRIEILLTGFRLVVLVVLSMTLASLNVLPAQHSVLISLSGLAIGAVISAFCAIKRVRNRFVPWALATVDVGLLLHCLFVASVSLGLPLDVALSTPGAWLIFIYLIMGVLRLNAPLVLYSGSLFVVGWYAITVAIPLTPGNTDIAHATGHFVQAGAANEALRAFVILVSTMALAAAAWHSKRSLTNSLREAASRERLAAHFPKAILDRLLLSRTKRPDLVHAKAAIIFVDICGFTALSETMAAGILAEFLADYRSRVAKAVSEHEGIVDKFIGDGVLVVFGLPDSRHDDAHRALECVLKLRTDLAMWIRSNDLPELKNISFGIGVHYGDVIAGLIGDQERVEYTVLGDTVNVAARLQQLANANGGDTVLSEEFMVAAGLLRSEYADWISSTPVRGRKGMINVIRISGSKVMAA
nr:adenylate/guanylate cyclase domain-containing protein [uncultured Dongia sp.]